MQESVLPWRTCITLALALRDHCSISTLDLARCKLPLAGLAAILHGANEPDCTLLCLRVLGAAPACRSYSCLRWSCIKAILGSNEGSARPAQAGDLAAVCRAYALLLRPPPLLVAARSVACLPQLQLLLARAVLSVYATRHARPVTSRLGFWLLPEPAPSPLTCTDAHAARLCASKRWYLWT